ncbi:hypothetical protein CJA_3682 [Cellvibrio japonicus Ueda107]|uniref:Uncharacterized protein n=1 Tax=Cellvibrio japonicus (strain Ueda107) TaxID=498211 RepID=B3PHU1_CELJU|nr:hypothetical protein CJA_3682 [Cellvibrio japonicus Ueda107]
MAVLAKRSVSESDGGRTGLGVPWVAADDAEKAGAGGDKGIVGAGLGAVGSEAALASAALNAADEGTADAGATAGVDAPEGVFAIGATSAADGVPASGCRRDVGMPVAMPGVAGDATEDVSAADSGAVGLWLAS